MSSLKRISLLLLIITSSIGCNQSPEFAIKNILDSVLHSSYLLDTFRIVYAEISGVYLGWGASWTSNLRTTLIVIFELGFLLALTWYALRYKNISLVELPANYLIVADGHGSTIDRVKNHGVVVEFLKVVIGIFHTGISNVADIALMLGTAMIVLSQRSAGSD